MVVSEFQRRKLLRRFDTLDVNGSGYLELGDYLRITSRLSRAFPVAARDERVVALVAAYRRLWRELLTEGDSDGDHRVSRDEFVTLMGRELIDSPDNFDRLLRPTIEAVFDICDVDADGVVDAGELRMMLEGYGVPDSAVDVAVARIAPDGTTLDRDAFVSTMRQYYCGDDPAEPGSWMFGKLAPQT
ncbi:EF-hand domain-containing protein [Stackebrandtia nassauensis]|uniref:Putative signal transduction protein with EFhand domain n=1 Tax=Stackebrandtia nassauensis (strain DSM 44728 / CIP 108903 / NRRL B-16338 / NBRC 102104 / LLR-40K-21) TaxID=446470 RepID=D3Q0B0_STANL|nr:EF-hand domain-containing protein [Stackebrandtia nassauensis]ADD39774.1 putative signal transduction protein with EFhand domain [Stackebrandtia nassauensis DSM 44728]